MAFGFWLCELADLVGLETDDLGGDAFRRRAKLAERMGDVADAVPRSEPGNRRPAQAPRFSCGCPSANPLATRRTMSERAARLRVLLADDHVTVRHGLKLLIDGQPDMTVVGEASDGDGAIKSAARPDPPDKPASFLDPDAIATTYLHLIQQPRSAWAWEIELRPWVERF